MSADPIIQAPYNLKSFNRYSYVWNNPLKFFDPAGFEVWAKAPDGTNTQTISSGNGTASNSYTGDTGISCDSCGAGTHGLGVGGPGVGSSSCRGGGCTIDEHGNPIVVKPINPPIGAPITNPAAATPNPNPPAVAPPTPVTLQVVATTIRNVSYSISDANVKVWSFVTFGLSDKASTELGQGNGVSALAYTVGALGVAAVQIGPGGVASAVEGATARVVAKQGVSSEAVGAALGWTKKGANDDASRIATEIAAKESMTVADVKQLAQQGITLEKVQAIANKLEKAVDRGLTEGNKLLQNRLEHVRNVISNW
jgi:hypothetical protein